MIDPRPAENRQVSDPKEGRLERPVRILVVITSSDFGGSEEFLRQLVSGLDRSRFDITICSLRPLGRVGTYLASAGFEVVSLNMSEEPRVLETLEATRALVHLIDRTGFDLIQGLLYRANVIATLAARFSKSRPVVVAGQRSLGPMRGRLPHWFAKWSHRQCAKVVAVSDAVKEELVERSGIPPTKIQVIGNGVDTDRFRPRKNGSIRHDFGLGAAEVLVGTVGRLSTKKGVNFLLDALVLARGKGHPLKLLVIGDGPQKGSLEAQAESLDLNSDVFFLGFRSDLDRIYPELDIFALPSLEEGSPNALLEAMSCGCAPVASAVGGVPEIVEEGVSGLMVQPGSRDQLADALIELSSDTSRRGAMRIEARRRIEQRFGFSAIVSSYESLYMSLVGTANSELRTRP